jgi:hypothetical protein
MNAFQPARLIAGTEYFFHRFRNSLTRRLEGALAVLSDDNFVILKQHQSKLA